MATELPSFYAPDPVLFQVESFQDPDLARAVNSSKLIRLYKIDQVALQTAHYNTVRAAVTIYNQLRESGIKNWFIFPLSGALRLAYDTLLEIQHARPAFLGDNFLFMDKEVIEDKTVLHFYNADGKEIPAEAVIHKQTVWVDEMIDEAHQLKMFAELGLDFAPIALTPVGKEHTPTVLTDFYQSYNWPQLWSITSVIPNVQDRALWMMTSGQWNSGLLDPKDSIQERNCEVAFGVLADDIPIECDENGKPYRALAHQQEYIHWLTNHQPRDNSDSRQLVANILESRTREQKLQLIAMAFGREC